MQVNDDMVRAALDAYNEALSEFTVKSPELPISLDDIREAGLRAALEVALAAMWRPIEEAPKNTAILIKLPNLDYYGNKSVYAGMLVDMGTGKRWMTFGYAIGRDIRPDDWPTAWMPLPAPPSGG